MNPEQQRIAIAKACGWTNIGWNGVYQDWLGSRPNEGRDTYPIPDYLNDLNAMHEAEKTLNVSDEQITYWQNTLQLVCDRHNTITLMATAAQRAEAFLRAIGKWVETNSTKEPTHL